MTRRKRKPIQTISIILSVVLFVGMGLAQLAGSIQPQTTTPDNPSVSLIEQVNVTYAMTLNQSMTTTLTRGDMVALVYQGEVGDVLTVRVVPDNDILPRLSVYIGDSTTAAAVFDEPFICGLEIKSPETYQFVFGASAGDYRFILESGDTC